MSRAHRFVFPVSARGLVALALALTLAAPCAAQPSADPRCRAISAPFLAAMPDEPPVLHQTTGDALFNLALVDDMPRTDPARPAVMFEAAEAYRTLGRTADEIQTLSRIVREHPSGADADRVLFRLALALEHDRSSVRARRIWLRLVRDFPTSEYVQAAYVSFGNQHFARGDYEIAQQFFERATAIPSGRWAAYAHYRLAWTLARQGDRAALARMVDAGSALSDATHPQLGGTSVRAALNSDQASITSTLACAE
jgi:tetratricopeptide (TPR) repeat protein